MTDCTHSETKVVLCTTGPHYAAIRCVDCDTFIKWAPRPRNLRHQVDCGLMLPCPDCDSKTFVVVIGSQGGPIIVCGECGQFAGFLPPATVEKFIEHAKVLDHESSPQDRSR